MLVSTLVTKDWFSTYCDRSDTQYTLAADGWNCWVTEDGYNIWWKDMAFVVIEDDGWFVGNADLSPILAMTHSECVAFFDQSEWGKKVIAADSRTP